MIRKNKDVVQTGEVHVSNKIYRKIGKGILLFKGKLIKEGDLFAIGENENIPSALLEDVELVKDEKEEATETKEDTVVGAAFEIKETKAKAKKETGYVKKSAGEDLFDVYDPAGTKVTDVPLSEVDADIMLQTLNAKISK